MFYHVFMVMLIFYKLFSIGGWSNKRRSRLDQLIAWCGGDKFDGCLIFDECHKAKHFVPVRVFMFAACFTTPGPYGINDMLPNIILLY